MWPVEDTRGHVGRILVLVDELVFMSSHCLCLLDLFQFTVSIDFVRLSVQSKVSLLLFTCVYFCVLVLCRLHVAVLVYFFDGSIRLVIDDGTGEAHVWFSGALVPPLLGLADSKWEGLQRALRVRGHVRVYPRGRSLVSPLDRNR